VYHRERNSAAGSQLIGKALDGRPTMRTRALLYILVGIASLLFATRSFLNAANLIWRTTAPVPTGYRGHTRLPTTEESRQFGDRAKRQLTYSALGLFTSLGIFVAFGSDWRRVRRRRRAVEHADEAANRAARTPV
jgi:hypothetical protein